MSKLEELKADWLTTAAAAYDAVRVAKTADAAYVAYAEWEAAADAYADAYADARAAYRKGLNNVKT